MANTKILIVENIAPFDRETETRLKTLGYTICASVSDGAQAIEKIPELQVDLVMAYVGLEGAMAAVDAAEEIYQKFDVPVVLLIDSIEEDVLERIREARVFGSIFKPFDSNQLCLGIEHQLRFHEVNHENAKNNERLSSILNSVGDAIIAVDREGLITFINPVAESLIGWKMEEATGKQATDVIDIQAGNAGNLKKSTILTDALQKGSVTAEGLPTTSEADYNTWIVAKSGREIPIDYNISPIKAQTGDLTGIVLTFSDITKYKTNEEQSNQTISELRHQTQLMKTVFDSMYDGIVVLNLTGHVLFVNPSIQRIFSAESLGSVPSKWSETHGVFYPDEATLFPLDKIMYTQIAQGKAIRDLELFARNKEQTEGIHIKASGIPLFDENQKVVACVAILRDITADKVAAIQLEQTMQELQNQVQLTDTIFNSMGDGVIAADTSGAFTIFNPSAESILGIGPMDTTPDKWSENYGFFFPDRATPFPANELPLARALRGEASDEVEMFVRNPEVPEGVFISASGRPLQGRRRH